MKTITKYTSLLLGLELLVQACDSVDYPDRFVQTSGVPKVDFVRYADKDVVITQASMEELVCIVGDNLTSIHELYFNDQAAVLNTSYITAKTLLVAVPRTMPSVQTDKIYMITKDGQEVTYDFTVLPPVPKVTGMSLEWAQPGETVSIYGSYLFDPVEIEFPGADPVSAVAGDGSAVTVVVPEGAQPGKIKVTTASGTAQSVFQYKDSRGMLFDFDGLTGLDNHGWNGHNSQDDDGTGISGRFFQFGDGETALDGSWEEGHFSFVYWPGSWNTPENYQDGAMGARLLDLADFSDWQNMALKFEIFVPSSNPWSNTPMQICMAGVDVVSFGNEGTDIYGHAVADEYLADLAGRVEVTRGAASVLYGSNAMGGAINIITRKPSADGNNLNLRLLGGSYGTFRGNFSDSYRRGRLSAGASLMIQATRPAPPRKSTRIRMKIQPMLSSIHSFRYSLKALE